jgi:hypothetical protein
MTAKGHFFGDHHRRLLHLLVPFIAVGAIMPQEICIVNNW